MKAVASGEALQDMKLSAIKVLCIESPANRESILYYNERLFRINKQQTIPVSAIVLLLTDSRILINIRIPDREKSPRRSPAPTFMRLASNRNLRNYGKRPFHRSPTLKGIK